MDILQKLAGWAGWALLALIAFSTLSPIGLRPQVTGVFIERFGAFALIGFLFAIGYPRHAYLVLALVVGAAVGLELAQLLIPGRHGEVSDAVVKILGGVLGVAVALAVCYLARMTAHGPP